MTRELDQDIINAALLPDGDYKVQSASVYTPNFGDCTNGGVSKDKKFINVVGPGGHMKASEVVARGEALFAIDRLGDYISLTEVAVADTGLIAKIVKPSMVGPMAGGNLACGDSRWVEIVPCAHAVPIHDRWETPEQYDILSR